MFLDISVKLKIKLFYTRFMRSQKKQPQSCPIDSKWLKSTKFTDYCSFEVNVSLNFHLKLI